MLKSTSGGIDQRRCVQPWAAPEHGAPLDSGENERPKLAVLRGGDAFVRCLFSPAPVVQQAVADGTHAVQRKVKNMLICTES